MKYRFALVAALLAIAATFFVAANSDNVPAAKVRLVQGIPVYVLAEPDMPYEIVETVSASLAFKGKITPETWAESWAERGLKLRADGVQFDAIIGKGNDGILVRWK